MSNSQAFPSNAPPRRLHPSKINNFNIHNWREEYMVVSPPKIQSKFLTVKMMRKRIAVLKQVVQRDLFKINLWKIFRRLWGRNWGGNTDQTMVGLRRNPTCRSLYPILLNLSYRWRTPTIPPTMTSTPKIHSTWFNINITWKPKITFMKIINAMVVRWNPSLGLATTATRQSVRMILICVRSVPVIIIINIYYSQLTKMHSIATSKW